MGSRVEILEHNVALIRQDLSVVLSNYVTKADMHREISQQTWKIISWTISWTTGICSALTAAVYFITTR